MPDDFIALPGGPDPGFDGASFPGWLKKRGAMRRLQECEQRCPEFGFTAKNFIKMIEVEKIQIPRTGNGNKVLKLVDKVWADRRMCFYVPEEQHQGKQRLKPELL
jgi:hypothetical protein